MAPSPIPKFDNPKMHRCPALQLFGAGREKRIYAVPPYTPVREPRLRGPPVQRASAGTEPCALCGSGDSFLDEMIIDDSGGRMFVCSDTDYCAQPRARPGHERR